MMQKEKTATDTRLEEVPWAVTQNPCVVCAPLGAAIAFAGIEGGMTILHGSQGCATYIRRYLISHFREPVDIASSSFTEESAVFGGASKLTLAYRNVREQYHPSFVGMASTCLAETTGEDAPRMKSLFEAGYVDGILRAFVSTASYRGDQRDGFLAALRSIIEAGCPLPGNGALPVGCPGPGFVSRPVSPPLRTEGQTGPSQPLGNGEDRDLVIVPTMVSTDDLRFLKESAEVFGLKARLVSDWSDSLDGGPWKEGQLLPPGGTPVASLAAMAQAKGVIELGEGSLNSAGDWLKAVHHRSLERMGLPIGIEATDRWIDALAKISGRAVPESVKRERERLIDTLTDGHKTVSALRALVYGDKDLVAAISRFLKEIGIVAVAGDERDFTRTDDECGPVDLLIGSSKGYKLAKKRGVPLVRVGFPVHDRIGGQHILHLGYRGSRDLFERITNALIERAQEDNDVGYTYY